MMTNIDDIQRHKEHLQAKLDCLLHECDHSEDGLREAKMVVEFQPFSVAVENAVTPENIKTWVLESYNGDTISTIFLLYIFYLFFM